MSFVTKVVKPAEFTAQRMAEIYMEGAHLALDRQTAVDIFQRVLDSLVEAGVLSTEAELPHPDTRRFDALIGLMSDWTLSKTEGGQWYWVEDLDENVYATSRDAVDDMLLLDSSIATSPDAPPAVPVIDLTHPFTFPVDWKLAFGKERLCSVLCAVCGRDASEHAKVTA